MPWPAPLPTSHPPASLILYCLPALSQTEHGLAMVGLTGLLGMQEDTLQPSSLCVFSWVPTAALALEKVGSWSGGPCCFVGGPGFPGALLKAQCKLFSKSLW